MVFSRCLRVAQHHRRDADTLINVNPQHNAFAKFTSPKCLRTFNPPLPLTSAYFISPGDQHSSSDGQVIENPFEETKPRVSQYTAQEIATLQSRLEKQLGPEYISSRSGPSGQKVHYIAAEKCIQLANEVFGFNGWSSQIKDVQVDFLDENPQTLKINIGISVIIRVTLRDGTYHEDVGYGNIENCKGKAAAFEKAKKEATTDALKRALKNFGNVLGNCIYDKDYLSKITKIKVEKPRWDVANLHRHPDYMPPPKRELQIEAPKGEEVDKKGVDGAGTSEFLGILWLWELTGSRI